MKQKNLDMTQGDPLKLLTVFTLPAIASNLLNQVYSITDSMIVGRYLGQTSLAAVGVCMPIILLVSAMVIGLNIGVGIILSQCFGRHDYGQIRHALANSVYLGLALGVVTAVIGIPLTEPILRLLGTPEGPMKDATAYMNVTFMATVFPIFYYMFSNAFRGIGDSYTALYCLIVSVVSNVFLDYAFVAIFDMGVVGTAYATVIAQGLSVLFAVVMLWIKYPEMRMTRQDFRVDGKLLSGVTKLAVPIAIQSGFNNLGNVVVQGCINGFGETVMAAYTVGSRLGSFSLMPVETLGGSMSVYAGQNMGAEKLERIPAGVRAAHVLNLIVSTALGVVLLFLGRPLTLLFLPDAGAEILSASYRYLLYAAVPGVLFGVMHIYQHTLRGVGRANQSMAGSFMQLGVKVVVAVAGGMWLKNLDLVWLAWPLSYLAGAIYPFIDYRENVEKK